jgi:hypothetical protein
LALRSPFEDHACAVYARTRVERVTLGNTLDVRSHNPTSGRRYMSEQGSISSVDAISPEHLLKLITSYEKTLDHLGYSPIAYPDTSERVGRNVLAGAKFDCLNHAYWMCGQIRRFVGSNRMAKALRWLGTLQGLMLACGVFSIDEIRAHDRDAPDPDAVAGRWGAV